MIVVRPPHPPSRRGEKGAVLVYVGVGVGVGVCRSVGVHMCVDVRVGVCVRVLLSVCDGFSRGKRGEEKEGLVWGW